MSRSEAQLLENASSVLEVLLTNVFCATERKGRQREGAKCRELDPDAGQDVPGQRAACLGRKVGSAEQMCVFSILTAV